MRQKLNIITLGVKNFEQSLNFYEKVLGWKKSQASQGDIAFFPLGGIVLALYPRKELVKDITINDNGSGFGGITLALNAKSEQEVNTILIEVEKAGAKIIKTPQHVFWGGYSGYFSDLNGFIFEVAYNPFFEFDSNDNLILT